MNTTSPKRGSRAAKVIASALLALTLGGCGGFTDSLNAIADGLIGAFTDIFKCTGACTASSTLPFSSLSSQFELINSDGQLTARAQFKTGGGGNSDVVLDSDFLTVTPAGGASVGFTSNPDGVGSNIKWVASLPPESGQTTYTFTLTRRSTGAILESVVKSVPTFAPIVLQPVLKLNKNSLPFQLRVTAPTVQPLYFALTGNCNGTATTSASFNLDLGLAFAPVADGAGSLYNISPKTLSSAMDVGAFSGSCTVTLVGTSKRFGTNSAALRSDSVVIASFITNLATFEWTRI